MSGWKLYKPLIDVDGSCYWYVNGEGLNYISYHSDYNVNKFYDWNRNALEVAAEADVALSILADYFEEQPTKEQLDQGQCKCWRFHIDFKNEVLYWQKDMTSDGIADWIERKTKQYSLEEDLMEMLKKLSIAISIEKVHTEYIWTLLDRRGTASTFIEALEKALEYAMERFMIYLEFFTE